MFRHIYLLAALVLLLITMVFWSQDTAGKISGNRQAPIAAQVMSLDR